MATTTWLVETAWRPDGYLPAEWLVRSGYGSESSARSEIRQMGAKWRKAGLTARVREATDA